MSESVLTDTVEWCVLWCFVEVQDSDGWHSVCQWSLGEPDIDDLYDAIDGIEYWPDDVCDAAKEVLEQIPRANLRLTHASAQEVLEIWPLKQESDLIRQGFLHMLRHYARQDERFRVLFWREVEGEEDEREPDDPPSDVRGRGDLGLPAGEAGGASVSRKGSRDESLN